MEQAQLLGSHSHATDAGVTVSIWKRGAVYIGRGRLFGRQFGKSLGADTREAAANLRHLLVEIDNGAFERPTEARRRPLQSARVPRLTIRQLSDRFVAEKRRLRGKATGASYRSRLVPLIEFAEQVDARRRWPLALDVDREFAVELRRSLFQRQVTGNGHPGAAEAPISPRQIFNVLDCARSMFSWAKRPDVGHLPAAMISPFGSDLVGTKPRKDPLRPIPIPLERRIELVRVMGAWQLCHFALGFVLPLRPEDEAGLLISELDFENHTATFGTRFAGRDFNKGRQSFTAPWPADIEVLLRACVGQRREGPVLQRRTVWEGRARPSRMVNSPAELADLFSQALRTAPRDEVQNEQDAKRVFRRLLGELGGVSTTCLAKEFKPLAMRVGLAPTVRFYALRESCNTEMERSKVSAFFLEYLKGHAPTHCEPNYLSFDPTTALVSYFDYLRPLLAAIVERAHQLRIP